MVLTFQDCSFRLVTRRQKTGRVQIRIRPVPFSCPQPSDPTQSFTCTYDAWQRLVKVADSNGTVGQYSYDVANRRTQKTSDGNTRHYYYSANWQVLEERVDSSPTADRQFVWGLRYIDDLVCRDPNIVPLFSMSDANWNVVAFSDESVVLERFRYDAYGVPTVLDQHFVPRSPNVSAYDWETRFAGYPYAAESGFYEVRRRYLNPVLGAWATRDPLGLWIADTNLMRYVANSPTNLTDPAGLIPDAYGSWEYVGAGLPPPTDEQKLEVLEVQLAGLAIGISVAAIWYFVAGVGAELIVGTSGTTGSVLSRFFTRGAQLANDPKNVAALQWYRDKAEKIICKYQQLGGHEDAIATQQQRINTINELLKKWGAE